MDTLNSYNDVCKALAVEFEEILDAPFECSASIVEFNIAENGDINFAVRFNGGKKFNFLRSQKTGKAFYVKSNPNEPDWILEKEVSALVYIYADKLKQKDRHYEEIMVWQKFFTS